MVRRFCLILLILLFHAGAAVAGPAGDAGPGLWIGALDSPDSIVLDPAGIAELNREIIARIDQMADVAAMDDEVPGTVLRDWLAYDPLPGADEPRFLATGDPLGQRFFSFIRRNMAFDTVMPVNPVAFGVVVKRADIRAFPSEKTVIKRPGGFDTFQYSSIASGQSVALLHKSRDGRWGFFQTRFVRGWIRLDNVAFGARALLSPDEGGPFIVVTGSSGVVYSDRKLKDPVMELPMGGVLYLAGQKGADVDSPYYAVRFPAASPDGLVWKTGYVDRLADVHVGFLPYTRRNIINQAFKMLGEEYGWGGEGGRRDCSAFVMDVFASVGVRLPRNSAQQSSTGFVRLAPEAAGRPGAIDRTLAAADPATTLIALDGHIMLYLGSAGGGPHVIHQIWGYMDSEGLNELKKVSVTGLELGAGSASGAFRERIRGITEVNLPPALAGHAPAAVP